MRSAIVSNNFGGMVCFLILQIQYMMPVIDTNHTLFKHSMCTTIVEFANESALQRWGGVCCVCMCVLGVGVYALTM